eukprot:snap_masked-scaffold_86-processed-gene-0.6-mRNA-1 protein AED:1.00 eAED:1.00 QI:0/0/0/0/1/1/2/0/63
MVGRFSPFKACRYSEVVSALALMAYLRTLGFSLPPHMLQPRFSWKELDFIGYVLLAALLIRSI